MNRFDAPGAPRTPYQQDTPQDLLAALGEMHSSRNADLVQRTRRNVMQTAHRMQAGRSEDRRRMGLVLFIFGLFVLLLTPALWAFCEEIFGGSAVSDSTSFTLVVFVMLFSTVIAFALGPARGRQRSRRGSL